MNGQTRAPGAEKLGRIEYVIESARSGTRATWLVMRADAGAIPSYAQMGLTVAPGARVVVDAASLQPIGVLDRALPAPSRPAGFNPYFDPPIAA
jgi:hypothetical protein